MLRLLWLCRRGAGALVAPRTAILKTRRRGLSTLTTVFSLHSLTFFCSSYEISMRAGQWNAPPSCSIASLMGSKRSSKVSPVRIHRTKALQISVRSQRDQGLRQTKRSKQLQRPPQWHVCQDLKTVPREQQWKTVKAKKTILQNLDIL